MIRIFNYNVNDIIPDALILDLLNALEILAVINYYAKIP